MKESEIIFTRNISADLKAFLNKNKSSQVCILVDENTALHCLPSLQFDFPIISIKSGESNKTLSSCEFIWNEMTKLELDRNAMMINLGGGVIGDMGGFCAATYKRGINFIQIPTTLLSQVDASVGGKLGIDFKNLKNHIGVFQNPAAVFINVDFLNTLPQNQIRSGYAEVIKHCLIADKEKWNEIKTKPLGKLDWENVVQHSIKIKTGVTTEDPTEKGLRKILNFGHTIGHAIESYFLEIPGKELLHGEAISVGMICEAFIARLKGFISQEDLNEISKYIIGIYDKVEIFDYDMEKILPLTFQDKKNSGRVIMSSLLQEVGKANFNIPITIKEIRESILYYNLQHA